MTTKKHNQTTVAKGNRTTSQPSKSPITPYASRYVAVDSHLSERNGTTDSAYGLAGERPAGRKLAQDVANICNQLHFEGYEVISIVPLTSGRAVEAVVEVEEAAPKNTFMALAPLYPPTDDRKDKKYVETSVGYSVTDGVIITARLSA